MEDDLLQEPEEDRPGREVIVMLAVFFEAGLAPLSLASGLAVRPSAARALRLERGGRPDRRCWQPFPWCSCFWRCCAGLSGRLLEVKKFCDHEVVPLLNDSSWSEIALVSLSAGVGEEMLFRGVIQTSIGTWLGMAWGLVLSSLLFGFFHPISLTYMIIASILGVYLGAVLIADGNLLTSMVVHALYDFAALGYLLRIRPTLENAGDS